MLLSAVFFLVPSLASALSDPGYGEVSRRSYSVVTPELSDLRGIGGFSSAIQNDTLVSDAFQLNRCD